MTPTAPLRDALRDPFSEGDLARLWPAVEARRSRGRRLFAGASALVMAGAAAATAFALAAPPRTVSSPVGPLHLATGAAVRSLDGAAAGSTVTFDDRSRVALSAEARVEPSRNDDRVFEATLVRGQARFDVTPRGPRRWTLDCGLAKVTVLGTSFVLQRAPERVRVEVLHGLVRVEGERVAGGVRVLSDGESIEVTTAPPRVETPVVTVPAAPPAVRARVLPAAREVWRDLAAQRDFDRAYVALGPGGTSARAASASADDLLALGEVAHRSRHYAEAASLYARFIAAHRTHPQAAVVGFTLGRIQLDQLGASREAAGTFADALALGVPRYLQEDVHARRVEALARAGDREGARAAAAVYLQRFPDGRRAADVRRWAE
jgi:transmembrane sensor